MAQRKPRTRQKNKRAPCNGKTKTATAPRQSAGAAAPGKKHKPGKSIVDQKQMRRGTRIARW